MAILGNSVKGATAVGAATGRIHVSKSTLASAATLTELHGWFGGAGVANNVRVVIYADSAGSPGARVAYTGSYVIGAAGDVEIQESGFSVALAAGDYWIGWIMDDAKDGLGYAAASGSSHALRSSGATYTPPPNPFGGVDFTGTRNTSCWAVTGVPVSAFVPRIVIT